MLFDDVMETMFLEREGIDHGHELRQHPSWSMSRRGPGPSCWIERDRPGSFSGRSLPRCGAKAETWPHQTRYGSRTEGTLRSASMPKRSSIAAFFFTFLASAALAERRPMSAQQPTAVDPITANDPQFVGDFDALYQKTWGPGAIPEKHKQLSGVSISIVERCEACLGWHLKESLRLGATRAELVEALRLGLLTGGSITIPTVRKAYELMDQSKAK